MVDDCIHPPCATPPRTRNFLNRYDALQAVVDYSIYDKTCLGEKASAADLWACQTASSKSHRPLLEGLYASQVGRWQRAFDESQVRCMYGVRTCVC